MDERDLLRLIEGECSPDEAKAIQSWVAADPRRGELLDELRAVWRLTGGGTRQWDVAAARRRLLRAYNGPRHAAAVSRPAAPAALRPWRSTLVWTRRLAVASCVVAIAAILATRLQRETPTFREYATAAGQRATISLVDGTRVQLSVDSKLRILPGYGAGERAVELEGEAYFFVRHDEQAAFVVHTKRGTARDLGTEFAVRAYPQESYLQVVVATDSVALTGAAANPAPPIALTLRPRDRAVIDEHGRATVVAGVALEHYVAWTRGRLVFDDDSLAVVLAQLERWYDLDIGVDDPSLRMERITISFETESADEALSALAKVLNVRMRRSGRSVRLVPGNPFIPQQR